MRTTNHSGAGIHFVPRIPLAVCIAVIGVAFATAWSQQPGTMGPVINKDKELTLTGHKGVVLSVAFSPDSKLIASSSSDHTVRLWDLTSGKEIHSITNPHEEYSAVVFSPDGKTLAIVGRLGITFVSIEAWTARSTILSTVTSGRTLCFSPDSRVLAAGEPGGKVNLWDVKTGSNLKMFRAHKSGVVGVSFDSSGKFLLTCGRADSLRTWDLQSGAQVSSFGVDRFLVREIVFSPDGKLAATTGMSSPPKFINVQTGAQIKILAEGQNSSSIVFSRDSRLLFGCSADSSLCVWNVATGRMIQSTDPRQKISSIAVSPDGKMLAAGSSDQILTWRLPAALKEEEVIHVAEHFASGVNSVSVAPNGALAAFARADKKIILFNLTKTAQLRAIHCTDVPYSIAISRDNRTCGVYTTSNAVSLWNLSSGKRDRILLGPVTLSTGGTVFSSAIAFSGDGSAVASLYGGSVIKVWETRSGRLIKNLEGDFSGAEAIAFNPKRPLLAATGVDRQITLWNPRTGAEIRAIAGQKSMMQALAFSPKGDILAAGSYYPMDGTVNHVRLWDASSGQEAGSFAGNQRPIAFIAFSSDGRTLASGDYGGNIIVWDLEKKILLYRFTSHYNIIHSLAFVPRSSGLISGCADGYVKFFDCGRGTELATLEILDESDWVMTTPDGHFDGTPGGRRQVYWTKGDEVVHNDSLAQKFRTPRLLERILGR